MRQADAEDRRARFFQEFAMKPFWLRVLLCIAAVLLVTGALFGAYHHGLLVKDAEWLGRWNGHNTLDAKALAANEAAERAKEQARQLPVNKAIQDGQQLIDQVTADAAAACADEPAPLPLDSQPVKPAAIPVMPPQARQLPALTSERATWLRLLTRPAPTE